MPTTGVTAAAAEIRPVFRTQRGCAGERDRSAIPVTGFLRTVRRPHDRGCGSCSGPPEDDRTQSADLPENVATLRIARGQRLSAMRRQDSGGRRGLPVGDPPPRHCRLDIHERKHHALGIDADHSEQMEILVDHMMRGPPIPESVKSSVAE